MTFRCEPREWRYSWVPTPDDEAAHASLLAWLRTICAAFLPAPVALSTWLKGNIGEAMAHCVGDRVKETGCHVFCANALDPLSGISKTEIDIVWMQIAETPAADIAVLQEVKTTTDPKLSVVGGLVEDYAKLFGTNVARTLLSRLHAIANEIEFTGGDTPTAARVRDLAASRSPSLASRMRLRPTVVHEASLNPDARLSAVREDLINLGWNGAAIEGWSIALGNLDDRIVRLAQGL